MPEPFFNPQCQSINSSLKEIVVERYETGVDGTINCKTMVKTRLVLENCSFASCVENHDIKGEE